MDILTSKEQGILTLAFNRPDKKNAITAPMYLALATALRDADGDEQVRVILLRGTPDAFTAGNDLADFVQHPPTAADSPVFQFMQAVTQVNKPLVAAVSGVAVGIGTTLLLHCDLVYAADNARFSLPFSQLGLCPELASSLLLPRLAGYQRAAEKLLLGEAFGADEAHAMGLVNRVLPQGDLLPFAQTQAARLVALPAASLRASKRLMKAGYADAIAARMAEENRQFGAMLGAPEAQEALSAFLAKRKPDFTKFS